ncbi:hypothetical protein [Streptomyces sp. AA1529]|uniref:hypothetical protein n=1 Tax=Streptomyces sp. AA1529 TaxID=1203257 RepID=UPI003D747B17
MAAASRKKTRTATHRPATGRRRFRHDDYVAVDLFCVDEVVDGLAALAVDNFQGTAHGAGEPLPTQVDSETLAVLSSGVIPYRQNTGPTLYGEAMPTFTSEQIPAVLTTAGWYKRNGLTGNETAPHAVTDPLGTLTSRDTTALLMARWRASLAELPLEHCFYRMTAAHEIDMDCGFDVDFRDHQGTFRVWGAARDQVEGTATPSPRSSAPRSDPGCAPSSTPPQDHGPGLAVAA